MKVAYRVKRFRLPSLVLIELMNGILDDYETQGYRLTVRQVYYQLVARNVIANTEREYDRITRLCNDTRMSGLMDWDMIEDRTREFIRRARWNSCAEILRASAHSYHQDMWANQARRVFCVVEKDALAGVLTPVCEELDVPLLAARGYPSASVIREFSVADVVPALQQGQDVVILNLGDHDPSGLDMTRDLRERLAVFTRQKITVQRIALNLHQVRELNPPENPAKQTDKRFKEYARQFGPASWELDALTPEYLARLVEEHVRRYIDATKWQEAKAAINTGKAQLRAIAQRFQEGRL